MIFALEAAGKVPYGAVVLDNETHTFDEDRRVLMHELGHSFDIGRADDKALPLPAGEVYSGSGDDGTLERVNIRGQRREEWSVMRSGWRSQSLIRYQGTTYYVFSVEELTTIERP